MMMDNESRKGVEKILVQGIKSTARLAFEASISAVEELEQTPKTTPMPPYASGYFVAGYKQALTDIKTELNKLLAAFAE